ncbi:MAG TPA: UbiA family prenyltransferase [Terrimicrobiaceae bacterium]|jgi:decaprenyl-phosphate phosphoribosyltransferase
MIEYVKVLRPDHWLKNVFIFFGHLVAIALLPAEVPQSTLEIASRIVLSLIPACLVASANYIINEILDAPFDRTHPTKRFRPVPAGTVKIPVLWAIMALLILVAFVLAARWFNAGYVVALALLLLSGIAYNVEPVRLKDRAYLDVIAESFNNPIRLWLGWYALLPATYYPPLSIVLAWWFFGALLMAGKRYAEFRFIGDARRSGEYRKSFRVYTERSLILSMVTHANFFCFCMGVAIAVYRPNLVFVFPLVVVAICVYLHRAMSEEGAKLEPEHLLKSPLVIACTVVVVAISAILAWTKTDLTKRAHFFELIGGKEETNQ